MIYCAKELREPNQSNWLLSTLRFSSQGGDMRPIFYGSCYPNTRLILLQLTILLTLLFSIAANAGQPYHQVSGSIKGYEDEDKIANTGNEWSKLPKYTVSQTLPARINSWVSRAISLTGWPTDTEGKIIWRFFAPDGTLSEENSTRWTGSCWTNPYICVKPGWGIESPAFVADEVGLWRVETYDSSDGIETLISSEPFEVKGREMQIISGSNLTVYEDDNSKEPLALMLIDYDHVSGTPNKLVSFQVINRPKGKASGGLNYYFKEGSTGSKINNIDATTNFAGVAKVYFESGNNYGTYIIKATSFWAPEHPVEFQITVKQGKNPDKEEDLITELIDSGRNLGKPAQCEASVGNPINVINGNKYQEEIDYRGKGFMPLEFIRYYNSNSNSSSGFGPKWSHSYSRFITTTTEDINGIEQAVAKLNRDNGQVIRFYKDRKTWLPVHADVRSTLTLSSKKWTYTTELGLVEVYNQQGQLQSITHIDGNMYTLEYSAEGKLNYVYSPNSSRLSFEYNADNKIQRVTGGFDNSYKYYSTDSIMLSRVLPTFGKGSSRDYHYEDENFVSLLSGITDENDDRVVTWTYNDKGQAISSSNGDGINLVNIEYYNDGSRRVTHADGKTTEYLATGQLGLGLLTNVDGPTCNSGEVSQKSFQYDPITNNLLAKTIDGVTTRFGNYDDNGNPGYIIEALGTENERRSDFTYDPRFANKLTHIQQPSVSGDYKVTHFTYDDAGHLLQQREQGYMTDGTPLERVISYRYNGPLGQLSSIDGPRTDADDSYYFSYHPLDATEFIKASLKEIVGPDGTVLKTNIRYSYNGDLLSYTTANGLSVENIFHRYYKKIESHTETANGISRTTFFTYTPAKQVSTITTGYGSVDATVINLTYDNTQRLTKLSNGFGDYIEFIFDANNNVIAENIYDSNAILEQQILSAFDSYNNINHQTSANQVVKSVYATDGRVLQQTNGNDVTSNFSYDQLKRLTAITNDVDGINQATANSQNLMSYDVHNNQTQVTDANGNTTSYEYDDLGNLLSESSPDKGNWTYAYDAGGNRITVIDAKQQVFNYQYDDYNRILLTDTAGTKQDISYFYDLCTNGIGKLCRVLKGNSEVSYTYNVFGEVASQTQVINNLTTTVSYSYDLQGRIKEITYPSGSVVTYSYDIAGNIQALDLTQNEITQSIISDATYTFSGLLTSLNFSNGLSLNNSYDLAGRLASTVNGPLDLQHSFDGAANLLSQSANHYEYDALNRLKTASINLGEQAYNYDKNSNRLTFTENSIQTQYGIVIGSNLLSNINALLINNDANGNRLNHNGQSLQYSPYNQLSQVTSVANYSYNGLGQRVQKTLLASSSTTSFVYDLRGQLLVEVDDTGNVTDEHIYLGTMPAAVLKHQANNSELYYVHTDHLNTPRAITNSDKAEVWQWQSDPFGNGMENEDVDSNGISFEYNKRFTGQYYDSETGLHYNYYRDYDPKTGRYLQSDPIGLNGGTNTFGYVGGNPMMYTDPLGLIVWKGKLGIQEVGVGFLAGQRMSLNVTSECLKGKVYNVKASGLGFGLGRGLDNKLIRSLKKLGSPSFTWANIELNDDLPYIDTTMFNGSFLDASISFAWGVGYSKGTSKYGQFKPEKTKIDNVMGGIDSGGVSYVLGHMSLDSISESTCECTQ